MTENSTATITGSVWTLHQWEYNGYDDSDFFARVYDDATGHVFTIPTGTTRGWCASYDSPHPKIASAPADVQERAKQAVAASEAALYKSLVTYDAELAVNEPALGRRVRVTRGRKVPVGTEGDIAWVGVDKFKSGRWATFYRFGLDTDDGRVFVNDDYVEVIDGLTVDYDAIDASAAEVEASVLADPAWYRRNGGRAIAPSGRPSPKETQRYLKEAA